MGRVKRWRPRWGVVPKSVGEKIKYAGCVQNGEGFENYSKWSIGIK